MRGKAVNGYVTFLHVGITPAYAGKSCSGSEACKPVKDHPRLCGEKGVSVAVSGNPLGSPPPMRGKD